MDFSSTIPHVARGWTKLAEEWNPSPSMSGSNTRWEKLPLNSVRRPIIALAMIVYGIATPLLAILDLGFTGLCKRNGLGEETPLLPKHHVERRRVDTLPYLTQKAEIISALSFVDEAGWSQLMDRKEDLIAGYLEIGKQHQWVEGGSTEIGALFTRVMFRKFIFESGERFQEELNILSRVDGALYRDVKRSSRAFYDNGATGWDRHAISRIIGYVGDASNTDGPFFEILINSARHSENDDQTYPFAVSVMSNASEANKRHKALKKQKNSPSQIARHTFYSANLVTPLAFSTENEVKLSPHEKRLLDGINYLSKQKFGAQKVGNCWMRQPMLCILVSLYVEFLTHRPDATHQECWKKAQIIYNRWNTFAAEKIKSLVFSRGISQDLSIAAQRKLLEMGLMG